jgi:hypothetical protein
MDFPPTGPNRSTTTELWGTPEERQLATQLLNLIPQFHIVTPVEDTVLNQTFFNLSEFESDLHDYMTTRTVRSAVYSNLRHWRRILGIANGLNAQPSYDAIVNILNQLERGDDNANEKAASTAPWGAQAALQWTALERLINLIDKHIDTQV